MRSERDIKRAPKRALTDRLPERDAAAKPAAPPAPPARDIPVSYASRGEHPGRPARGDERRDERRPARGDRDAAPRRGPSDPRATDRVRREERDMRAAPSGDRPRGGPAGARPATPGSDRRDPRAAPAERHPAPSHHAKPLAAPRPAPQSAGRTEPGAAPRRVAAPAQRPVSTQDGVRLSKVLGDRGLASRREADDWIAAGWVRVDGEMAVLGQRVGPQARIEIDPAAHGQQAKRVTILLNKPIGYVSGQPEDDHEPAVVLITAANHWAEDPSRKPFHPGHARGLAPAGRLDIDSTGLLVLTQDGRVAKHLIGEDSDVEKEYLVRVEHVRPDPLPDSDLKLLNHGLMLDDKQLKPAKVSWANEDQLRFVLREGRKRQIRRMCELVGLKVVGLKRVRIGSVVLGKLPAGQWRYLRDDERF